MQKLMIGTLNKPKEKIIKNSLILSSLFNEIFLPSPLITARYLKNFYSDTKESFNNAVRKILYDNINLKKDSKLFEELVQLCVSPGKKPNLDSIITYNYDDILEYYLDKLKIDVLYKAIYKIGMKLNSKELPIYHVHGFLPRKGSIDKNNHITLSEDVYHQQYLDTYSWNIWFKLINSGNILVSSLDYH